MTRFKSGVSWLCVAGALFFFVSAPLAARAAESNLMSQLLDRSKAEMALVGVESPAFWNCVASSCFEKV